MNNLSHVITIPIKLLLDARRYALTVALSLGVVLPGTAAPVYSIDKVLIPSYELDVPFAAQAPSGLTESPIAAPVYKPHEVAIDSNRGIWISSNERGAPGNAETFNDDGTRVGEFRAGISIFSTGSNRVLSTVIIDEPAFAPLTEPNGFLYHGMDLEGTTEPPEDDEHAEAECPLRPEGAAAFLQTVFLPIVLPPNSVYDPAHHQGTPDPLGRKDYDGHTLVIVGNDAEGRPLYGGHDAYGRAAIMSPMGAECHSRHPHGIDIDKERGLVYLLLEHSGLRWNQDRSDFIPAANTDEESGSAVVFDIGQVDRHKKGDKHAASPRRPKIVTGYLFGHGAHELAINENNGFVFQGNHENSPGVEPPNWTDVINPSEANPYGFIDTGFYQALQDIEVDEDSNTVYNVSHVGERLYAFDGSCKPTLNDSPTYGGDNPATPEVEQYLEKQYGENCIKYWVDLHAPFDAQVPEASEIFTIANADLSEFPTCLPSVLHYHNLAVDPVNKLVYNGLHSIHHAEHTGLPWEEECPEGAEGVEDQTGEEGTEAESEVQPHFNGRTVVKVDVDPRHFAIDPQSKQAIPKRVRWNAKVIDLSNGYGYLDYPNVEDVVGDPADLNEAITAVNLLENSFVHPHWLAVDVGKKGYGHRKQDDTAVLLVSGEHTGNIGVVDTQRSRLSQVLPVSIFNVGLQDSPSSDCEIGVDEETGLPTGIPDDLEPHAHGLQIDPRSGTVYVSDEGEHCFYESVIILKREDTRYH